MKYLKFLTSSITTTTDNLFQGLTAYHGILPLCSLTFPPNSKMPNESRFVSKTKTLAGIFSALYGSQGT